VGCDAARSPNVAADNIYGCEVSVKGLFAQNAPKDNESRVDRSRRPGCGVSLPKTRPPYATWEYSCSRPPSRSRRMVTASCWPRCRGCCRGPRGTASPSPRRPCCAGTVTWSLGNGPTHGRTRAALPPGRTSAKPSCAWPGRTRPGVIKGSAVSSPGPVSRSRRARCGTSSNGLGWIPRRAGRGHRGASS
jgi:hypothetical protein